MIANKSFRIYPRIDKDFKKKNSLDFDIARSLVNKQRPKGTNVTLLFWLNVGLAGIGIGIVTFLLDILCEGLAEFRAKFSGQVSHDENMAVGWIVNICFTLAYTLIACLLTVYVGPGAMGSGVAECMGWLNGVQYPKFVGFATWGVKFFGVAFAATAGICAGKEGPLVHMGYIIGVMVIYLPFGFNKYFRNDTDKRLLGAIGCAAGVSAAFGAPIGGALFGYELSKPNTFWDFTLTWKVFFCCSCAVQTLNFL